MSSLKYTGLNTREVVDRILRHEDIPVDVLTQNKQLMAKEVLLALAVLTPDRPLSGIQARVISRVLSYLPSVGSHTANAIMCLRREGKFIALASFLQRRCDYALTTNTALEFFSTTQRL